MAKSTKSGYKKWKQEEALSGYAFLVPIYALLAVFVFYGIFFVLRVSFMKWDGIDPALMQFRGLNNYIRLFTDPVFYQALINITIWVVVTVSIQLFLGLTMALLLRPKLFGHRFFKALFYIPAALSTTIIARIFVELYEPNFGILNTFFTSDFGVALHLTSFAQNWLGDPNTALGACIAANIFQWTGAQMVFYIAGLTSISDEVFEAAQIDGAGFFRTFFQIVWPLLWPTHTTVIILGMIGGIKTFDIVWLMTGGGPGTTTAFPSTMLYNAVAKQSNAGYGGAIAVFMIVLCVVLSAIQLKLYSTKKDK